MWYVLIQNYKSDNLDEYEELLDHQRLSSGLGTEIDYHVLPYTPAFHIYYWTGALRVTVQKKCEILLNEW